jgi:hypothetical protein
MNDSSKSREYDAIRIYVDALGSSATRCRRMLVVLAVASVLFFVAYWNSRDDAWLNLRIRTAQACLRDEAFLVQKPEPTDPESRIRFLDLRSYMTATGLFAQGVSDAERKTLLENDVTEYRKLKKESVVLVHVPFFLSVFDINDLGIMAGITFSLLLMGYWFSVTRERDTLYHSFHACRSLFGKDLENRQRVYDILSTSQVLNVPNPSTFDIDGRARPPSYVKKYLAKLLVVPPFMIQAAIMWNDQSTLKYGLTLGQQQTSLTLMVEGVLLFAILALTILCTLVSIDITRTWDDEFAHATGSELTAGDEQAIAMLRADLEAARKADAEKRFTPPADPTSPPNGPQPLKAPEEPSLPTD